MKTKVSQLLYQVIGLLEEVQKILKNYEKY